MRPRHLTLLPLLLLLLLLAPAAARADITAVWAVSDTLKVKQDDQEHKLKKKNEVFDGKTVKIFGARNEVVAFQVIIENGENDLKGVGVTLDNVGDIKNGELSADPYKYWLNRNIEIFQEHYLNVTYRSAKITWAPFTDAMPKGFMGWLPDPLVPLKKGATFAIEERKNQGIWVDVYIPKDTKPGVHKGTLTVNVNGKPCGKPGCKLPIELEVISKTMPDEPSTKALLYFSGSENDRNLMPSRYYGDIWQVPLEKINALRLQHFQLGWRHRIIMFIGQDEKPNDTLLSRLTGKAYTREQGYYGPGEGIGQSIYAINSFGSKALTPAKAAEWKKWFAEKAPKVDYFFYVMDEPKKSDYAKANRLASQATGVPTFITARYTPALKIDIFTCVTDHYSEKDAQAARAAKKRLWIYNGVRPYSGSFMTDDYASAMRVNPWIQYKYKIPLWFYWESTYYKDSQGGRGDINVWTEAGNFSNGDGDKLNGDGLLIYPGRDIVFPTADKKFQGPVPSVRLKMWRRGQYDADYLALAAKAGMKDFVDKLVKTMVPLALNNGLKKDEPPRFPDGGENWVRARKLLFQALKTGKAPAIPKGIGKPKESSTKKTTRWLKRIKRKWLRGKRRYVVFGGAGMMFLFFVVVIWLIIRRRRRRREEDDY